MNTSLALALDPTFTDGFLASMQQPSQRPAAPQAASTWEEYVSARAEERCGFHRLEGSAIAIQPVTGYMAPGCEEEDEAFFGCFNTLRLMDAADAVAADESIKCLVLHVSSPGGSAMMVQQAAQAITGLKARRPDVAIVSLIEGLGCSAAMWISAAADEIHAIAGSMVGSISTILMIADSSQLYANAGIKVHALTDGKFKSIGQPGVPLTDDHIAHLRSMVQDIGAEFKGFMASRREGLTDEDMQGQSFFAVEGKYPAPLLDSAAWATPRDFYTALQKELTAALSAQ